MFALRVFVCLVASSSALMRPFRADFSKNQDPDSWRLANPGEDDLTQEDREDMSMDVTCPTISDVPMPSFMSLADDAALNKEGVAEAAVLEAIKPLNAEKVQIAKVERSSLRAGGKAVEIKNDLPKDAEITKFVDAVKDARTKKQEFMLAQAKLMAAMEGLLEVPAADRLFLAKAANGASGKDSLIVFYAPWCPHCQKFVLHDAKGNPRNAPLEVLRRDMAKDSKTKNIVVARADTTKIGSVIPSAFEVVGIPTMYFVSRLGQPVKFTGSSHDSTAVMAFVQRLASA